MSAPDYMSEPWFALLRDACERLDSNVLVAGALGVSAPLVGQVLNGSGAYGRGEASTRRIAERVLNTYGNWPCPYLTDGEPVEHVISAEQCRGYAHRDAPTRSPRDLAHWRACQSCPRKERTAPPAPRVVVPRGKRRGADAAASDPVPASPQAALFPPTSNDEAPTS